MRLCEFRRVARLRSAVGNWKQGARDLVKTKPCVGEGLCLHSGAPAWLHRV